ncbi:MAG TPA: phosphoglucomutase/phosphomannomutase family protein [Caldilineae bacterium]|nr:phosphoglucomutase/phosphomannomutase family protein [Caldilineae bacterium]HIQ11304.1 phosphoglucomutase/phosphomannomutase family protein [Caldilineales bacterium]
MTYTIKFGTDGWRGKIAEDYTFDNVRRAAQGFANYLHATYSPAEVQRGVVVGGDRRFGAEDFTAAVAEVLAGNNIPVHFAGFSTPTPVISYSVVARNAIGAVNITASHNPPSDNGFKVRDPHGGAIDPAGLKAIEAHIPDEMEDVYRVKFDEGVESGLIMPFDPKPAYVAQIEKLVDLQPIRDAGLRVAVEPMWGNGAGWLTELLAGGSTQVFETHSERNPIFPEMKRPEPIPPNVDAGLAFARSVNADVVCIMDGDADRCGLGDEHGQFVDQLRVFGLLAMYFLDVRGERGPIVKSLNTTVMLNKLAEKFGVPIYETGVGFKYIAPKMQEVHAMIGGEESGGYAFGAHIPERDGILANLFLLDLMVKTGLKPTQLLNRLFGMVGGPHYYHRIDTPLKSNEFKEEAKKRLDAATPETIAGLKVREKVSIDGYKFIMEDGGWLTIRFSGTEPLIRVYAETTHQDKLDAILDAGLKMAGIE